MKDENSKVDKINETLYSRTEYKDPEDRRSEVHETDLPEVSQTFESPKLDEMLLHDRRKRESHPIMKRVFTFAVLFFVAAVAIALYIYLGGGNLISSKNVDITILAPVAVSAGEPLDLGITISNKNNTDLTSANMVIHYPEGTRSVEDSSKPLISIKDSLGAIPAGESVTRTERAELFGQKGDVKVITISIDYKVKGSNATFTKEKTYEISIGSTPVTMTISAPNTVTSGNTFTTTLTLLSNSPDILKDVVVRGEYPYGFTAVDSTPKPSASGNSWILGDLSPGDKKIITIKGVLNGEDQEERTFRFYAGVANTDSPDKFDSELASLSDTVGISKSSLGLTVKLNGDSADSYVAPAGQPIQTTVEYRNNLSTNVSDAIIQVRLSGLALDKFSITPQNGGFYNSIDSTITWDKSNFSDISLLGPGDGGAVSFKFASLSNLPAGSKNSEIKLSTTFKANPPSGDTTSNPVATTQNTVKVASEIALSARSLYSRGPFKNTGSLPPKAEATTTYTVVLDLGNTQNDVDSPKLVGTLGPNVKWLGKTSPTSEKVSFDQGSNTFTWTPDSLPSGAGFSAPGKEVSIQVSLTPSIGQIGSAPILVSGIRFTGIDSFTHSNVSVTIPSINTKISTDPKYVQGDEQVVK